MNYPAYSPDLAPSDFLFRYLQKQRGCQFSSDTDIQADVLLWQENHNSQQSGIIL